ncbi:MAG: hypothetical protein LBT55_04060, partial [Clostridiaceae bacterium]|nr:hypothetical protein [Clostridiaceae bacterium]
MANVKSGKKSVRLPYTNYAGRNDIIGVEKDKYGNPNGSCYDLLKDGSMKGYKILLIDLSNEGRNSTAYAGAINALANKGFVVDYMISFPSNFDAILQNYCQLWLLSGRSLVINNAQVASVKAFFESGRGVYLWGDNDPYYQDANAVIRELFGTDMTGDYLGKQIIGIQKKNGDVGIVPSHLISTGIVNFYEGVTIAHINMNQKLTALTYSSDGNVVTALYDKDGRRCLIDGGFTRLFYDWDSAGTDRYVVNAAGWLAN